MSKMNQFIINILIRFLFLLCFICGCAYYRPYYNIELTKVERPENAQKKYSTYKIGKLNEKGVEKYNYEDNMINIIWLPSPHGFSFILTNKTEYSIKIIWDEASYVDAYGCNHRIVHSGVRFIDRNNSQPPSVISKKSSINESIIPSDNVIFRSESGWHIEPLLPIYESSSIIYVEQKVEVYKGKILQVILPLQIENNVNEYIFNFKINKVEVK